MTTAHRPTWAPAKGNDEQGGYRQFVPSAAVSAKDLPGHLKLKFRAPGQHSKEDLKERDLRAELEIKERKHFEENRQKDLLLLEESTESRKPRPLIPFAADADDEGSEQERNSDSDSEEEESEDEEAELLAELERIKKEREAEAKRKEQEELRKQKEAEEEEMLTGNPLLNTSTNGKSFNIKRRWDEDVIFKNQSRGEPKAVKRFINDTLAEDERLKEAGNECFRRKAYQEAIEFYQRALDVAPTDSPNRAIYYGNKAACFIHQSQFQEALESCNEALKINGDYLKVLMRRCLALERLDQLEDAIKDAEQVLDLDPNHDQAKKTLQRLQKLLALQQEQRKEEMIGKLKDLGNSFLGKFGISLNDFKAEKDPETGSYNVSLNRDSSHT